MPPPTDIAQRWDTGLTTAQVTRRREDGGPNMVARPRRVPLVVRILRQLADPLVALLLVALVVTIALRDVADAAVIGLVVVVNTVIGVFQEARAQRAIAALDQLAAPTARVVRDGQEQVVPAAEIVCGDLVRVEAGDIIPADLRLASVHRLRLDESALTGESQPVARDSGDEAFAGTVVVVGRAKGVVVRIGAASALGRIALLVAATRSGPTPMQRRIASLGRILGATAVVLSAVVFGLGLLAGRPVIGMAITAVSLVVAAVPESLPAVVTLALALGARRMASHRAIPRRLHAVETLGSVTVVASDKTGTLTEGRMAVQTAVTAAGERFTMSGSGYDPTGVVHGGPARTDLVALARAGLLCADASLAPPTDDEPRWRALGDPMEAALVAFAARCGLAPDEVRRAWPRVGEHPFDQDTRRMTTLHRDPDGDLLVICKGAPESVLVEPLVSGDVGPVLAAAGDLAAAGLRVLAVASARLPTGTGPDGYRLDRPVGLVPLGLVGIGDPVRQAAPDIARAFTRAGVRLVLITGDHPATAAAVGEQVGIWHQGDDIIQGGRIQTAGTETADTGTAGTASAGTGTAGSAGVGALDPDRADKVQVYARTQPEQKLDIIAAMQVRGEVVAMTGDGVNDAPALRRADIGVAMGGGTDVARQAADLVLVDDNLSTVISAIGEGRRIYDNIRRFLHYALSGGAAEILVMLIGPFLGLAVPLLPGQILWVNLLTHGLPGVAMGAEPAEADVLSRPPRSPQESVLGAGLGRVVLATGALLAATVLGAGLLAQHLGLAWQSVVFMVLGLAQLGIAVAVRAPHRHGRGNPALTGAIALSALLQVAGVLVAPLRDLLGTRPLSLPVLAGCVLVSSVPALLLVSTRYVLGRRSRSAESSGTVADSG